ncbi:unnamed protein product [Lampetra fluviatilis]
MRVGKGRRESVSDLSRHHPSPHGHHGPGSALKRLLACREQSLATAPPPQTLCRVVDPLLDEHRTSRGP